ncbi:mRNA turnover protein 4 homolog [Hetaerina americana]|uniref:mRNA turnover protein 4 homolog n=1 Tax=Hetaerina americana TaxID=62018 RepID=UPI003A7F2FDD
MPRSKRDQKVSLTKTVKKGLPFRKQLADEIKSCTENYSCIFTFTVQNMRNEKLKDLRKEWRHSRFFFGKNKVMAHGLGKNPSIEVQKNIHKLAKQLKGQCGLLFTNKPKDEVIEWFKSYGEPGFARSGDVAQVKVNLEAGPCALFQSSMEPVLRKLGLPVKLDRGAITLIKDYTVCKKGDILTPEQARILKFLDIQMAEFKIHLGCVWTNNGSFEIINGGKMVLGKHDGETEMETEEIDMDEEST